MSNTGNTNRTYSESLLNIVKGEALYSGDSEEFFREITEAASKTLNVERTSIWMYAEDRTSIKCVDLFEQDSADHSKGLEISEVDYPAYFDALGEDRAIDAHDAKRDSRTSEFTELYLTPIGITSVLDAPIRSGGRTIGVICLEHTGTSRHWTSEEITYAGSLADLVSHGVEAQKRKTAEQSMRQAMEQASDAEAVLRVVLEQMPSGIRYVDGNRNYVFFNSKYSELYGFPDGLLKVGQSCRVENIYQAKRGDFGHGDPDELVDQWLTELPVNVEPQSWERVTADGRTLKVSTAPVPSGGTINIVRDISDRRRAEDELRKIQDELETRVEERTKELSDALGEAESSNRSKSEFLANMSHELRTPLNAIIGFSDTMMDGLFGPLNKKYTEYANDINSSGIHLLELVNDILDLARLEHEAVELKIVEFSTKDIIGEIIPLISKMMEKNHTEFIDLCAGHENISVCADRTRLKQVLLNVFTNAIKYNTEGGKVILECDEIENGIIRISITDTGIGITLAAQPYLFEAFNRLGFDDSNIKGTGIGLTISKHLMDLMGGRIDFESTEGEGSKFWIEIPRVPDNHH